MKHAERDSNDLEKSVASLQTKQKELEKIVREKDMMINGLQEELKQKERRIREVEKHLELQKSTSSEVEKEASQALANHQKEIEKLRDQYNQKSSHAIGRMEQLEAELRKKSI